MKSKTQLDLFSTSPNLESDATEPRFDLPFPTQTEINQPVAQCEPQKWKELLKDEFEAPYFRKLKLHIKEERARGKTIYPSDPDIFNALKFTPFDSVKVVILGQDPYHGAGQAHGLSFSVRPGVAQPPSLQNIFKELKNDLSLPAPADGCLERWARQGVLLLNAILTVEASKPASHQNMGWEQFTDRIVDILNERKSGLVFMLWGSYAQNKGSRIDPIKHQILKAPHPSPFSANRGFFGCKHFSKANRILEDQGVSGIGWG